MMNLICNVNLINKHLKMLQNSSLMLAFLHSSTLVSLSILDFSHGQGFLKFQPDQSVNRREKAFRMMTSVSYAVLVCL